MLRLKIVSIVCLLFFYQAYAIAGGKEAALVAALKWLGTVSAGVATAVIADELTHPDDENEKPPLSAKPSNYQVNLRWNDHVLNYQGVLFITKNGATLRANVYDIPTGMQLTGFNQNVQLSTTANGFSVSGIVAVRGDSTTTGTHQHQFNLFFSNQNGIPTVVNCVGNQCYTGEFL